MVFSSINFVYACLIKQLSSTYWLSVFTGCLIIGISVLRVIKMWYHFILGVFILIF